MPALITNYTPTADAAFLARDSQIMKVYKVNKSPGYSGSISFRDSKTIQEGLINSRIFDLLNKMESLQDNWDGDNALAPNSQALQLARGIASSMTASGQKIYNTTPGPKGEIMLDFRNNVKSLEVLLYPEKMKFVKFGNNELPTQGAFNPELLPELITWLNS